MERTVRIVLGDWSGDGHGQTETLIVKLSGQDVSDEVLAQNYADMSAQVGMDLANVVADYEESSISAEFYEQLLEAGFTHNGRHEAYYPSIRVADVLIDPNDLYSEQEFGAVELAMFYVGHKIPDFTWSVLEAEFPTLLGGPSSIVRQKDRYSSRESNVTSFGYGLFL